MKDSEYNPLFEDLEAVKSKRKKVLDLGCGVGELISLLSKRFGKVVGIDYSKKMIETAIAHNQGLKNVEYVLGDMNDVKLMKQLHNSFDVVVSSNSILGPDIKHIHKILKDVRKVLKKKGKFFAILPATEIFLYEAMLIINREVSKGKSEETARKKAVELIRENEHDFILGKTNFDGWQKTFYEFEILFLFKKAGFKNIKMGKVLYSWKEFKNAGQAYFPGQDLPWDWYVSCEK